MSCRPLGSLTYANNGVELLAVRSERFLESVYRGLKERNAVLDRPCAIEGDRELGGSTGSRGTCAGKVERVGLDELSGSSQEPCPLAPHLLPRLDPGFDLSVDQLCVGA